MQDNVTWRISPGGPLAGDVTVQGSKNAVTKHMIASVLADGPCTLANAPNVGDVRITTRILQNLGVAVERDGEHLTIDAAGLDSGTIPVEFSGLNRMPVLLIGPLLHRIGEVEVPFVGGDDIGPRPIDFHVSLLEAFGAEIEVAERGIRASVKEGLRASRFRLPYPSVGATESALLTAVLAPGRTVISNCALEPEVNELARFLQRMGAHISFEPNRRIVIHGVDRLKGATHRLDGDRIEAFSYLVAGAITCGNVRVRGCSQAAMTSGINVLQRIGFDVEITDEYLQVLPTPSDRLGPIAVETDTHPGVMTDWQAPLVALLTQVPGASVVHETVYENRFTYVPALRAMGARIDLFPNCLGNVECRFQDLDTPHSALVSGRAHLHGANVHVPDVRGGFAYAIAAAAAEGDSTLTGAEHMERGYSDPSQKLQSIGVEIDRSAVAPA